MSNPTEKSMAKNVQHMSVRLLEPSAIVDGSTIDGQLPEGLDWLREHKVSLKSLYSHVAVWQIVVQWTELDYGGTSGRSLSMLGGGVGIF